MDGWKDKNMEGQRNIEKNMDGQKKKIDGWLDGWMDGQKYRWMDKKYRWIVGLIDRKNI